MVTQAFGVLSVSCSDKDDYFVGCDELFESIFRRKLLAKVGKDVIKIAFFDQLKDDIETTLELAINIDLREGGPLSVEFQPLAEPFVAQDVKSLDVAVLTRCHCADQASGKFALRGIKCAFNEHHAWVVLYEIIDFAEGELLLLLE